MLGSVLEVGVVKLWWIVVMSLVLSFSRCLMAMEKKGEDIDRYAMQCS